MNIQSSSNVKPQSITSKSDKSDSFAKDYNASENSATLSGSTTTKGALSGASREFHNFINDIEDLIQATTSLTGEDLARAKAKLNARIETAKKTVDEMSGEVVDRVQHAAKATDGYVHEQPWQAVGIGVMVGLLIGFVSRRN